MIKSEYLFVLAFASVMGLNQVSAQISFTELVIDKEAHGDVKAIADLDNDGVKDLILAGAIPAQKGSSSGRMTEREILDLS